MKRLGDRREVSVSGAQGKWSISQSWKHTLEIAQYFTLPRAAHPAPPKAPQENAICSKPNWLSSLITLGNKAFRALLLCPQVRGANRSDSTEYWKLRKNGTWLSLSQPFVLEKRKKGKEKSQKNWTPFPFKPSLNTDWMLCSQLFLAAHLACQACCLVKPCDLAFPNLKGWAILSGAVACCCDGHANPLNLAGLLITALCLMSNSFVCRAESVPPICANMRLHQKHHPQTEGLIKWASSIFKPFILQKT